ncbi:hypothetical protein JOC37_001348 [Desulfohalotomaculum tongense]|uniref:hypothetical protein n=1 Tax=Desulforadius tongensis TaxID=1216062 RepID=UPI001959E23C|nr:hypothetical protein [Desulforadius tongensis]MBM7854968.1 hypothetical protein [Desulforadius tongensis]
MSKLYIYSRSKHVEDTEILEISTPKEVREVFKIIKTRVPKASIGVYGAKDFATLQRTHRNQNRFSLYKTVDEFIDRLVRVRK